MAYSWGGYESLILANQPEHIAAIRPQGEIDFSGTLIRLHIGLEDVDDLIADLDAGLRELYNIATFGQFCRHLIVKSLKLLRPGSRRPGRIRSTIGR